MKDDGGFSIYIHPNNKIYIYIFGPLGVAKLANAYIYMYMRPHNGGREGDRTLKLLNVHKGPI